MGWERFVTILTAKCIDLHAHVRLAATDGAAGPHGPEQGTDENGQTWYRVGNYKILGVKHKNSPFTDPDLRIQRMDSAYIDFQVVSPSPLTYFHYIDAKSAIAFCRKFNDALAALVRRYPGRLAGFASLPMQAPDAAAEELERAVCELGLWGAATGTEFAGEPLHSPAFDKLYDTFVRLDVPLCLHPAPAGIDGPPGDPALKRFDLDVIVGFAAQETIAVATLIFGGVMERHPKLDIWISHGGGSAVFSAARLAQAGRKRPWATASMKKDGAFETMLRRFWFDAHLNDDLALQLLVDKVGIDRVVFGTNFAGWDQPEDGQHGVVRPEFADNARRFLRKTA